MKTYLAVLSFYLIGLGFSYGQDFVLESGNFGGNGTNAPKLELDSNHRFIYTDLTNKRKPIKLRGYWNLNDGKLIITATSNYQRTKYTFKIKNEGKCLTTRKGLTFYRLCNCE